MKTIINYDIKTIWFTGRGEFEKYLHFLAFNRPYSVRPSLVESMKKHGWLSPILLLRTSIIDGVERLYIIDGQNRSMAAAFLDIPFCGVLYNKKELTTKEEIVDLVSLMHRTHKGWGLKNYVHAYATLGFKDYAILYNTFNKNPYAISSIANVIGGYIGKSDLSSVRNGSFKVKSLKLAQETIDMANNLDKLMNGRMLVSFHKTRVLIDDFDFDKFKPNFESNYKALKASRYDDYFEIFKTYAT